MQFIYCRTEFGGEKAPEGFFQTRLWRAKMRRKIRQRVPKSAKIILREMEITCYFISADAVLAEEQLTRIQTEAAAEASWWYEEALAQRQQLVQPIPSAAQIAVIVRQLLREPPQGGGRRESLLVMESEAYEDNGAWAAERMQAEGGELTGSIGRSAFCAQVLEQCVEDLNHVTIITAHPESYEALRESVYEREGLLIACIGESDVKFPFGRRLFILNFGPRKKLDRNAFAGDTFCFDAGVRGIVKFLDTALKNRYNIYS